jgi:hypothetical protein
MTINTTSGTVTSINPNPLPTSFTGDTETQCKNASGGIFRTFFNKVLGRFGLRKN